MRGLMTAVVAMGVLIVAGVVVLGVVIARRVSDAAMVSSVTLEEPPGTRIVGVVAGAPDRLVLQLQGGGADRVVVMDLRTGRPATRIALGTGPAR